MATIVLDTNIILQAPDLLGKAGSNKLVIPSLVATELLARSTPGGVALEKLLTDALKSEQVELVDVRISSAALRSRAGSHGADMAVVAVAQRFVHDGEETIIASEDLDVVTAARVLKIRTMTLAQLTQYLGPMTVASPEIENQAARFGRDQKRFMVVSLVVGIGVGASLVLAAYNLRLLTSTISVWGTFALVIIGAMFAYWSRGRYPSCYGVVEIVVGVAATIHGCWPNFDYSHISQADFLTIAGGIYIMVRGQDNLGKGLTRTRWGTIWKRYSGE